MKLTVKSALEILQGIGQLDSYQNGADKPTLYKYSGDVRLRIAIARRKLRAISEDYNDTRNAIIMELTDGQGALPPAIDAQTMAKQVKFLEQDRALLKTEINVDIPTITAKDLNLDENPIPPTVLDMLGEFVDIGQ